MVAAQGIAACRRHSDRFRNGSLRTLTDSLQQPAERPSVQGSRTTFLEGPNNFAIADAGDNGELTAVELAQQVGNIAAIDQLNVVIDTGSNFPTLGLHGHKFTTRFAEPFQFPPTPV